MFTIKKNNGYIKFKNILGKKQNAIKLHTVSDIINMHYQWPAFHRNYHRMPNTYIPLEIQYSYYILEIVHSTRTQLKKMNFGVVVVLSLYRSRYNCTIKLKVSESSSVISFFSLSIATAYCIQ